MARRLGSRTHTIVRSVAFNVVDGLPAGRTPEGQMPLQLGSTTSHRRCRSQSHPTTSHRRCRSQLHPHGKMPTAPAPAPRASTEKVPSRLNGINAVSAARQLERGIKWRPHCKGQTGGTGMEKNVAKNVRFLFF
jgi:hypothetical protein